MEREQLERTGPVTLRGLRKRTIQVHGPQMFSSPNAIEIWSVLYRITVLELLPTFRGQQNGVTLEEKVYRFLRSFTKKLETEAALGKSWAKPPGPEITWRWREEIKQGNGGSNWELMGM